jgi:uncharacterized membrane protein YphA (DoxX/SURF4 family)
MTTFGAVDQVKPILTILTRSQWIPQLLVRLFIGYFFFETGWAKIGNLDAMAERSVPGRVSVDYVLAKRLGWADGRRRG